MSKPTIVKLPGVKEFRALAQTGNHYSERETGLRCPDCFAYGKEPLRGHYYGAPESFTLPDCKLCKGDGWIPVTVTLTIGGVAQELTFAGVGA